MTGRGAADEERELVAAYGPYYRVARAFVRVISQPEPMDSASATACTPRR